LDRKMTKPMENLKEAKDEKIKECVRCGFCCKQAPCSYGEVCGYTDHKGWPEGHCKFLQSNYGYTYICGKYDEIKHIENGSPYPMFGSGCSSPLFNKDRENVMRIIAEKAAKRCLTNG